MLAANLSDDHWFKSWLVILAPAVTAVVTYLWSRMRFEIDDALAQRSARIALQQARGTLHEILNDQNTSEEHKAQVRKDLEGLDRDFIRSTSVRFRSRLRAK